MYKAVLDSFDLENLPNLDTTVLGALELFEEKSIPKINPLKEKKLIIGSEGAYYTAKIIFGDGPAVFADQSNFKEILNYNPEIDQAIIVSASGGKDAVKIAGKLVGKLDLELLTTNSNSRAGEFIPKENITVFPYSREPYTYNTSPYLAMILGRTGENPTEIKKFLQNELENQIPDNLSAYNSFVFILPDKFAEMKNLINIKFEELFGGKIFGRSYNISSAKHAKSIIKNNDELLIGLGENPLTFEPLNALALSIPESTNFGLVFASAYYLIGKIQKANPPYFKENLIDYTRIASQLFGEEISPIVE